MNNDRVVELLTQLVTIESVNLAYPGGVGEAAMADAVDAWARDAGFRIERQEVTPGQDNVLITLDVPDAAETLLFEAHMDTVALAPMGDDALQSEVRDGKLYGRGSCDTKGSLASMMAALERLRDRRDELSVNVALLAAVDEEHSFTGILRYIDSDAPVSAAIVGEPTELQLVTAHKGCVRGIIRTVGRASHSAEPHLGVSAIDAMADVLVALRELPNQLQEQSHPLLGSPTFSVGLIDGGTGVNVVPEHCTITYDRRTLPGEETSTVLAELDGILDRVRAQRSDVQIERPEPALISYGLDTPIDEALVVAARLACEASGVEGTPVGVPYGTDASTLQRGRDVPAIVLGPGSIAHAHGAGEFVPIDDVHRAVQLYADIALHYRPKGEGQS